MAYGLKYELLCNTKKGNLFKTKISFDSYAGSDIDRNVPINPFKLRKDRAAVIKGTSLEFSIREQTDFEFLEFYTNKPKHIQVELTDAADVQYWIGFVDTQQYNCPYTPSPLNIKFTASDGLGLLKNEAFTLTGTQTQFDILIHCLDKIGLGLGFAVAIGIHETHHNTAISPLEQTTEPCNTFEKCNCYEVIEKILTKYDAEIFQWKGRWRIITSRDKKTTRLLYTSAGVYEGTEAAPSVLTLGFPSAGADVYPSGRLNLSLEPGGKQVHAVHNYGRKESLLNNYEFKDFAAGAFESWSQIGSFTVSQGDLNGIKYAYLEGTGTSAIAGITQLFAFDNSGGESILVELDYCPVGYLAGVYKRIIAMTVRFVIMIRNETDTYYLNELEEGYGEWTTDVTTITKLVNAAREIPQFYHFKCETAAPPISGNIEIHLLRHYGTEPGPNYHYLGVAYSKPVINVIGGAAATAGGKYEATAVFDNSTEIVNLSDINIHNADAPSAVANRALLYNNITFLESDGTPTSLWNIDGVTGNFTIIEALFKLLASRNRVSRQSLQGTLKGAALGFESMFSHAYNDNREFEVAEVEWDIYEEKFTGKFLEVLAWSDEDVTITIGEKTPASTTGSSSGSGSGSAAVMTPDQILAALLTVDGMGSLLDADMVDGYHAAAFALAGHTHADLISLLQLFLDMKQPSGFVDVDDSIIGFTDGTREFIIAAALAEYKFYSAGVPYIKTDDITVVISTDVGIHYIYFDANGDIQDSNLPWDLYSDIVPIATVNWTGSAGTLTDRRRTIQFEYALGNPASNNQVLQSTTAGVRSWGSSSGAPSPFQYATFGNPLNIDVETYKDWIVTGVNDAFTLNLSNASDGDAGMIELIVVSSGTEAVITFGGAFTKKMGPQDFVGTTGADNVISWRMAGDDVIYTIGVIE